MHAMLCNPMINAYKTVSTASASGRDIESDVLSRCALKLNDCIDKWDHPDIRTRLSEALKLNQRVWTILQTEVANDACQLPNEIRANILRLGAFIDKRTLDILIAPAKEKLNILVNINLNIASGLQGR